MEHTMAVLEGRDLDEMEDEGQDIIEVDDDDDDEDGVEPRMFSDMDAGKRNDQFGLVYTQYDEHGTVIMGRYQDPRASTGTLDIKFPARWDTFCIQCQV